MLGRTVTVTTDRQRHASHFYVEPRFRADFHAAMREMCIIVEYIEEGPYRDHFRVIDPSQAEAASAACDLWRERGYWRHPRQIG